MAIETVPPDYEPVQFNIPYLDLIGPIYRRANARIEQSAPIEQYGMLIEQRHCNSFGVAQGGLLATLADIAAARALVASRDDGQRALTISLNTDYVSTAPLGAWLEAHVQIKKDYGSVGFALCEIRHRQRVIVTASGAFKFATPP